MLNEVTWLASVCASKGKILTLWFGVSCISYEFAFLAPPVGLALPSDDYTTRNIAVIFSGFPVTDSWELCDAMNNGSILCYEDKFLLSPDTVRLKAHSGLSLPSCQPASSMSSGTETKESYLPIGLPSIRLPSSSPPAPGTGGVAGDFP